MQVETNDISGWKDAIKGAQPLPKPQRSTSPEDSLWMTTEVGKSYRVRLVQSPESYRQHWNVFAALGRKKPVISPAWLIEEKDKDVAWSIGGWVPGKKYAALVFDRSKATPTLRILQGGEQIFKPIRQYAEKFANPAGPEGPDFDIDVKETADGVEYVCMNNPEGKKPFTQAELDVMAKFTFDWRSQYKKSTPEEIRALWESLPEDKRMNPDRKSKADAVAATVAATTPPAPIAQIPTAAVGPVPTSAPAQTPVEQAATTSNPVSLF